MVGSYLVFLERFFLYHLFLRPFFLWPGERFSERSVKRSAQADGQPDRIQGVHAHVDAVGTVFGPRHHFHS